jgi:hypothetical protein
MMRKWLLPVLLLAWTGAEAQAQAQTVQIYVVRHAEAAPAGDGRVPLTAQGRQRAALLAPTFRDVKFTHLFASHTVRTRETLEPLALERSLAVVQLPQPGSIVDGRPVNDDTTRRAAIDPIATALNGLPAGSIAMVALNGESIYAVLNRLGVPLAPDGRSCPPGSACVPCTNNSCFPGTQYDKVWYLVMQPGRSTPVVFTEFYYGIGWQPDSR